MAKVSLHFGKSILDLDPDEVNAFLFHLAKENKAISTYFKHTVYGLRFFFRLYGIEDRVLRLPTVKSDRKVPVVLIYSAGLRVSEVCNLKISDIDSDRMQIRVVKSKGKYDRYTHKVAISNHRLLAVDHEKVHFQYKDYRKAGAKLHTALHAHEFLRRFCMHILPKGFVRIRHYGIFASKNKAIDLNKAKIDLGQPLWEKTTFSWKEIALAKLNINPDACPNCKKGFMEVIDCFLPLRGPPLLKMKRNTHFLDS